MKSILSNYGRQCSTTCVVRRLVPEHFQYNAYKLLYLTAGQARMRDQLLPAAHAHNDVRPITAFGWNATGGVFQKKSVHLYVILSTNFLGAWATTYGECDQPPTIFGRQSSIFSVLIFSKTVTNT
jgi:hypothetical protein